MDYFKKKNILIWVLIVLLVINIAAITTIILGTFRPDWPGRDGMPGDGPKRFLKERLNLSEEQQKIFDTYHFKFRKQMKGRRDSMRYYRDAILEELSKDDPDTTILFQLSDGYGDLHKSLKRYTIQHFIGMKEFCNPEQRRELNRILKRILNEGFPGDMPGRERHGRGMGRDFNKPF